MREFGQLDRLIPEYKHRLVSNNSCKMLLQDKIRRMLELKAA